MHESVPSRTMLLIAIMLFAVFPATSHAAAGDLDSSFGNGGLVVTNVGGAQESNDVGNALAIDAGGRIVVAGSMSLPVDSSIRDFAVVRYTKDGALDPSFGKGGIVTTGFASGSDDAATGAAIDGSGRIIVAGYSNANGSYDFALARYYPDGSLDSSFGSNGLVLTDFHQQSDDEGQAVALTATGKIVVAGFTMANGNEDFALAQYNPDGSLDPTFGSGGLVTNDLSTGVGDALFAVLLQQNGKIVAGGVSQGKFALARYNPDGSLDPTFGSGGLVVTSMPAYLAPIRALAQQPNGELVAAGTLENGAYGSGMVVARYQHDGTFDQHFGQQNGLASAGPISSNAAGVAIERDGKIIVVGSAEGKLAAAILITRFNVDGTPDEGFGAGGWVLTEIPGTYYSNANAVAIQSDGKLVVTGLQETQAGDDLLLARYDLGALGCTPDSTHLCLDGNRFQVSVNWTNYNTGVSALATAVPFRDESGFFYFQDSANIEVMVKMHNACKGYGHYWFFSAATTDVAYTITVTDTETGLSETYSNPAHVLSEAKTDQSSFSCP